MGLFDLFKKKPKKYDKKRVARVFRENPRAVHAAQRMFEAKHPTQRGKNPFQAHRPERIMVFLESIVEGECLPDGTRYTIIEVVSREDRELDELARESLGGEAFQEWLDAQQVLVERRTYQDRVPTDP